MNQQVISDFLRLPGLTGLMLADQRSRPYVNGIYLKMTSQQRELLTQGICQVLTSIPEQFDTFEFQFYNCQIFIHRLKQGVTLMVVGQEQQGAESYRAAIASLTEEIERAGERAVAMMRLLASDWAPMPKRTAPPTELVPQSLGEIPEQLPEQVEIVPVASMELATDKPPETQPVARLQDVPEVSLTPVAVSPSVPSETVSLEAMAIVEPVVEPGVEPVVSLPDPMPDRALRNPEAPLVTTAEPPTTATPNPSPLSFEELFDGSNVVVDGSGRRLPASDTAPAVPQKSTQARRSVKTQRNGAQLGGDRGKRQPSVSPPAPTQPTAATVAAVTSPAMPNAPYPQADPPPVTPVAPIPVAPIPVAPIVVRSKDMLAALNTLSRFTTQYLGNLVIVNYWKASRPDVDWLKGFEIDRAAQFSLPSDAATTLTEQQQEWIRAWVAAFMKRCGQVIRDFSTLVDQNGLTETEKELLL